jgi:hypothetical protein
MTPTVKKHEKLALQIINKLDRIDLGCFVVENLYKFPIQIRKKLLGEEFKTIVKSKRRSA